MRSKLENILTGLQETSGQAQENVGDESDREKRCKRTS